MSEKQIEALFVILRVLWAEAMAKAPPEIQMKLARAMNELGALDELEEA